MTETTLGVKDTTWTAIEVTSALLLGAITARSTYKAVKNSGGLGSYLKPKGDFWKSTELYSGALISILVIKNAADAAKKQGWISGARQPAIGSLPNGFGMMNYF